MVFSVCIGLFVEGRIVFVEGGIVVGERRCSSFFSWARRLVLLSFSVVI